MAKVPLDPQHNSFQLVTGASEGWTDGWRGIAKDANPSSLSPNQLRHALNVRYTSGTILGRKGSTQIADLDGVPYYMGNFGLGNPHQRLWLAVRGCFGVGAGTGASVLVYDPEISTNLQTVSRFIGPIDNTPHFGSLGDKLFIGYNSLFREVPIVDVKIGSTPYDLGASQASLPLKEFTGFTIVGMREFPEIGMLFIGLQDNTTPTNGKIVSYNGLSFTTEYTGLRPYAFGRWRNTIIAGFLGNVGWRSAASSTWTLVVSAGFTCFGSPNAIAEYIDKTYIAGGADKIYSWDGTTVATARTIAGCDTTGEGVTGVVSHMGLLFYLWNTITTFRMKLGKFDPASSALPYIDVYKDLFAQNAFFTHGDCIVSFASVLYAARPGETLIASPMDDVQGTWVVIGGAGSGTTNFGVLALFPF